MSNNGQLDDEQAVQQLTVAWNLMHEQEVKAWCQQVQADAAEQEETTRLAQEEVDRLQAEEECLKEEERREQEKKCPKMNDFNKGRMVSDHVLPRPSQFAIGKLKSFNFVELWYLTDEGCCEAQDSSRIQSDDAYALTKVDDLVALKPVASFKASWNVIPNADLTWNQLNVGKNTLIRYMEICSWIQKHIQSFAHFYFNLELDLMHARPNGEKVLIIYHARVRRQWHDDLSQGQGFNIMQINQKLLSAVTEEVWDTIRTEAIKKVSTPSKPHLTHAKSLFSLPHYSLAHLICPQTNAFCHTMPFYHVHMCTTQKPLPKKKKKKNCHAISQISQTMPCHIPNTPSIHNRHAMPHTHLESFLYPPSMHITMPRCTPVDTMHAK